MGTSPVAGARPSGGRAAPGRSAARDTRPALARPAQACTTSGRGPVPWPRAPEHSPSTRLPPATAPATHHRRREPSEATQGGPRCGGPGSPRPSGPRDDDADVVQIRPAYWPNDHAEAVRRFSAASKKRLLSFQKAIQSCIWAHKPCHFRRPLAAQCGAKSYGRSHKRRESDPATR